jgi:nucleotide-binding universal stress UspA family protein
MKVLQSILFSTDFGPACQQAAEVVAQLALAFRSRVTLLHVLTWGPLMERMLREGQEQWKSPLRELGDQLASRGVTVDPLPLETGSPGDLIVRKAAEIDANLIVIGAGRLRTDTRGFFVGPVAQEVLEQAAQPVLAVRPGKPTVRFQRILCPVDQSPAAARGLRNAVHLAQAFGTELVVLTVVPDVSWLSAAVTTGRLAGALAEYERQWENEFDSFLQGVAFGSVRWQKVVRKGEPDHEIGAAVEEHQADMLVMGATGRTGLARVLLGSVTRRLLQRLPCSLLTVKQEDVGEELFQEDLETINRLWAEGRDLLGAEAYPAASSRFRQVLARNPFHVAALEGLALACEKLGQDEEAQRFRRRAERLRQQ